MQAFRMNALRLLRGTILFNLFAGFALLCFGMLLGAMPYAQLDAVLTPEEHRDRTIREATQAHLLRTWGHAYIAWVVSGAVIVAGNVVGYMALERVEGNAAKR
jgi:hypothetical protein